MKKKHHAIFCVGLSLCVGYELLQNANALSALGAAAFDGLELAILFYGLVWTSRQIFGECASKSRLMQPARQESAVQRIASRV
jgi:hypothetical protein